jgi:hypothetical protein
MNANSIRPHVGPQEINNSNKKLESVKGVLNMNKSSPAVGNLGHNTIISNNIGVNEKPG